MGVETMESMTIVPDGGYGFDTTSNPTALLR